jgi:outer membrane protein assembly factor BamA/autotransporter translocation and assembly factor TamB
MAALGASAVLVLHSSWARTRALTWATTFLDARYQLVFSASDLNYNAVTLHVAVNNVRLAARGHEDAPFFTAKRVEVRLPRSVFRRIFAIDWLHIEGGATAILHDEAGVSNLPEGPKQAVSETSRRIDIRAITLGSFDFQYHDRQRDLDLTVPGIEADLKDSRSGATGRFSIKEQTTFRRREQTIILAPAETQLTFDGSNVLFEGVPFHSPDLDATVKGDVRRVLDSPVLNLSLNGVAHLDEAVRWITSPVPVRGSANVRGTLTGAPSRVEIALNVSGNDILVGRERGLRVEGPVRVTPDIASSDGLTFTPASGGTIRASFEVPFATTPTRGKAQWTGLDAQSAFRIGDLDPLPLGAAMDGELTFETGNTRNLQVTNRSTGRARGGTAAITGTAKASLVGDKWRVEQSHTLPGLSIEGALSGVLDRAKAVRSTVAGSPFVRITDVASAADTLAIFRISVPALARRIHGALEAPTTLSGTFERPIVHADVSGTAVDIPTVGLIGLKTSVDADSHQATFADIQIQHGSARVTGNATADIDRRLWSGTLHMEASDAIDLQSAVPESWRIAGPVQADATLGGSFDAIQLDAKVTGSGLTLAGQPIDQLTADATVTASAVDVKTLELNGNGAHVAGRVKYDWDTDVYDANLDGTNLTYRASLLAQDDTLATFSTHFEGTGTTADLGGAGKANFSITGGTAGALIGDGDLTFELLHDHISYTTRVPSLNAVVTGTLGAFAPYDYRADATLDRVPLAPLARFANAREGEVDGFVSMTAKVSGAINSENGQVVSANLQDVNATVGGVPLALSSPTQLSWQRHSLNVDGLEIRVGKGKLTASGAWTNRTDQQFEGAYTGTVEDATSIAHAFDIPTKLDGTGNVTATFKWTGDPHRASGTLTLREGSLATFQGPAPVTGLEVDAKLEGESLTVSKVAGHVAAGGLEGNFAAHAAAKLPELTLDAAQGEIVLDEGSFTMSGVPVTQQRPSRVTFAKGVFSATDVTWLVADNPVVVSGTTTVKPDAETELDLAVKGVSDLRILTAFFPTVGFDGTGDIDAKVTGTLNAPLVNGRVMLDGAEMAVGDPRLVISEVTGPIVLAGETITIEGLQGSANGGSLLLDGRLQVKGLEFTGGSLNIQAEGVAMEYPSGLRSEVNALLTFRPDPRAPTLTGDVRVLQGSYTQAISLAGMATRGGATVASMAFETTPSYLDSIRLNVSVSTDEDLIVDNNYGKFEAGASVRLVGTVAEPGMDGRISMREGGELFIAGRTFRITRGDISFTDLRRIEPEFDIAADTHANGKDVTMTLTGTIDRPSLELTTPEGGASTGELAADIVGGGVTAENALTLLSADLLGVSGRAIGLDTLRVERGEQIETDFREDPSLIADETDPAARLTIAKRLSDQVEVTVSQNLRESGKTTVVLSVFPVSNFEIRTLSRDNATLVFGLRHRVTIGGGRAALTERPKPPVISAVTVSSDDPAVKAATTRKQLRLKAGDRFDFLELQRDVDRVREALHAQGYYEARVRTRRTESEDRQSVAIEYRIDRGPRTTVEVRGVQLSTKELKELEDAWVRGVIFDRFLVEDLSQHVRRDMLSRGELNTIVIGSVSHNQDGSKHVRIDVTPGIPVSGHRIRFVGNEHLNSKQLEEAIRANRIDFEPWFDPKVLERPLRALYSQHGYLRPEITIGPLEIDGTEGILPVRIVEGPQAQITSVSWTGVPTEHEYIVKGSLGLQLPQAFLTADVNGARRRVERAYQTIGFNNVDVQLTPQIGPDDSVALTFAIEEGPQQILQEVTVTGNAQTAGTVITEALHFEIGKPVNRDEWAQARKRLYDTNVFRQVTLEAAPTGTLPGGQQAVRADVAVQEYPPWTVRYGAQLQGDREEDLQSFIRKQNFGVVADIKNPNLFGRALTGGLFGQYQWDQRDAVLFLATSRLFGFHAARSTLFGSLSQVRLRDDRQNILAISHISRVTAEQRWKRRGLQVVYGYRLERNRTFDPDPSPLDPFPLDTVTYVGKLSSAALWDRRDDPLNAREGTFSSVSLDVSSPWLASDLRNRKLLLQQHYFYPLSDRIVFASRAQLGFAFGPDELLTTDAFKAGGATTVRGYAEDSLGPRGLLGLPSGGQALVILNGELRAPLYRWMRGVAFVDAGNIFGSDQSVSLGQLKVGYGFGLRLDTPVGLIRVDFGIPGSALNGVSSSRQPNSLKGGRWYVGLGHIF